MKWEVYGILIGFQILKISFFFEIEQFYNFDDFWNFFKLEIFAIFQMGNLSNFFNCKFFEFYKLKFLEFFKFGKPKLLYCTIIDLEIFRSIYRRTCQHFFCTVCFSFGQSGSAGDYTAAKLQFRPPITRCRSTYKTMAR